jgi:hypothetical protein
LQPFATTVRQKGAKGAIGSNGTNQYTFTKPLKQKRKAKNEVLHHS